MKAPKIRKRLDETPEEYQVRYAEWADRAEMMKLGLAWACLACGTTGQRYGYSAETWTPTAPGGTKAVCKHCDGIGITVKPIDTNYLAAMVRDNLAVRTAIQWDSDIINGVRQPVIDKRVVT